MLSTNLVHLSNPTLKFNHEPSIHILLVNTLIMAYCEIASVQSDVDLESMLMYRVATIYVNTDLR